MTTGYTIDEFLDKANKKFILLSEYLLKAYNIGYRYTSEIELRLVLSSQYIWVLNRLGNNYALSSKEIKDIVSHLIVLLELYDISPLDTDDFLKTEVKDNEIKIIYMPTNNNISVSYKYDTILRPATIGVSYYTDSNGNTVVYVNHKLNKKYPQYSVVEDETGVIVIPNVRFVNGDDAEFTFTSDSKGTITLL